MKSNRIVIIILLCVSMIFLVNARCNNSDAAKSSQAVTAVQAKDQVITASNFARLAKAVPVPQLSDSQERQNLVERLQRFNVSNKISYIYLVNYGKVMAFYTVKGKVSSVNSMLTCTEQIVDNGHDYDRYESHAVSSPDLDGSYGSNGDAIFFFTTESVYVEWNGDYMLVDQPLKLSTPPELVREID